MRAASAEDLAHFTAGRTTWAVCWKLQDRFGATLYQTNHDADIVVATAGLAGTYKSVLAVSASSLKSTGDLAVDNLNMDALLNDLGVTQADIEAGVYDDVEYTMFLVNWQDPTNSGVIFRQGKVGNITTFLSGIADVELRGIKQAFSRTIIRVHTVTCSAMLGDARCKVDLAPFTFAGTVTSVQSGRSAFTASALAQAAHYFRFGTVEFTSGANDTYIREVKTHAVGGVLTVLEPFPGSIEVGDTFSIVAGCDKLLTTCRDKFDNVNPPPGEGGFRGFAHIPGRDQLAKFGGQ